MRSRAFTLVEVLIVVLVIGILLTIGVPHYAQVRATTWQTAREENCRLIDDAKQVWLMRENRNPNEYPTEQDLVPHFLKQMPPCPGGCTWVIGSGDTPCSWY